MSKTLAKLLLAAAIAAGAGGWYWYRSGIGDADVVTMSGTLQALATVQVGAQIAGQVKDVYADFNTAVRKDQVIARIDPGAFEQRVSQAQADLADAESALATARAEREQPSQLTSAMAAVKQRQSLLRQAQLDLERTAIRAPLDGTVILRNVAAGQAVTAGPQAAALFTIAQDLREMQVEAAIDESGARRLRIGQPVTFSVDAFPRRSFAGEIREIRRSPRDAPPAAQYAVVISAANPDRALLPGMRANVRVRED